MSQQTADDAARRRERQEKWDRWVEQRERESGRSR
jgi:hypothetical protein